jgi:hypothetical protein
METKREKGKLRGEKDDLKEIILSDDSNIILPELSFPSIYQAQGEVKLGFKSTEQKQATEHELLEYQKRISRKESILSSDEIRNLVSETNERRRALEQSIVEQKQAFEQRHTAELQTRYIKQREESRAHRIANENDTQREMRIAAEEELKTGRVREIQALQNKCKKEKEEVTVFFEQSSGRFSSKYGNATKRVSGDTGIDRIISSRTFSTGRFAHRCIVCGYHYQESLSISKIYQHIYENKDQHIQIALSEIDKTYNTLLADTRKKHAVEDNPDLKQQRLSRELEGLSKLKGAKYR